jgi:hypothetical protein
MSQGFDVRKDREKRFSPSNIRRNPSSSESHLKKEKKGKGNENRHAPGWKKRNHQPMKYKLKPQSRRNNAKEKLLKGGKKN